MDSLLEDDDMENPQESIKNYKELLIKLEARKQKLKLQLAEMGLHTLPYIQTELGTVSTQIKELRQRIKELGQLDSESLATVHLQFADIKSHIGVGKNIVLTSTVLRLPERSQIPKLSSNPSNQAMLGRGVFDWTNSNYNREYADFLLIEYLVRPTVFLLHNTGSTLLANARLLIKVPIQGGLRFFTREQLPPRPRRSTLHLPERHIPLAPPETITIRSRGNNIEIYIDLGNIQPKAETISDLLYIGAEQPMQLNLEGVIFADNLPNPSLNPLSIDLAVQEKSLTVDKLLSIIAQRQKELERKIEEEFGED